MGSGSVDVANSAELSQTLCTAVQVCLVGWLARCGVRPSAVVGHSSGEMAAAYAAGAMDAREAIVAAYLRGRLAARLEDAADGKGGMAVVGLSVEAASGYLGDGDGDVDVELACDNSPRSVTLSGERGALEQVLDRIRATEPGTFVRRLAVGVAYHSREAAPWTRRGHGGSRFEVRGSRFRGLTRGQSACRRWPPPTSRRCSATWAPLGGRRACPGTRR